MMAMGLYTGGAYTREGITWGWWLIHGIMEILVIWWAGTLGAYTLGGNIHGGYAWEA